MKRHSILMTVSIAVFAIAVYAYAATPAQQRSSQTQASASAFSYAQLTIRGEEVTWDAGGNNAPRTRNLEAAYRELGGGQRASLVNLLNAIGQDGWELVETDGTIWIFKRSG